MRGRILNGCGPATFSGQALLVPIGQNMAAPAQILKTAFTTYPVNPA